MASPGGSPSADSGYASALSSPENPVVVHRPLPELSPPVPLLSPPDASRRRHRSRSPSVSRRRSSASPTDVWGTPLSQTPSSSAPNPVFRYNCETVRQTCTAPSMNVMFMTPGTYNVNMQMDVKWSVAGGNQNGTQSQASWKINAQEESTPPSQ